MIRTLISLDKEDKTWLDRRAKEEGLTMTQLVRNAVKRYREQCEASAEQPSLEQLLQRTAGVWQGGDGLAWQQEVRSEWEEIPEGEVSGS
jgi:hypothetical protein